MNATRIYWSPKVRRELIYRLYKSNESGVFDEELIDDVGFRLYERCESILMVTNRQVYCPICHTKFQLKTTWKDKRTHFPCPADGCPWEVEWEQYHQSFTKKISSPAEQWIRSNAFTEIFHIKKRLRQR